MLFVVYVLYKVHAEYKTLARLLYISHKYNKLYMTVFGMSIQPQKVAYGMTNIEVFLMPPCSFNFFPQIGWFILQYR